MISGVATLFPAASKSDITVLGELAESMSSDSGATEIFEELTPMLVMPFDLFEAQGKICKNVQSWREEALASGQLVPYVEGSGTIVIFISQTWWDVGFIDESNDPTDPYDKGAPDFQSGGNQNAKHKAICLGVR